MRILSQTCSSFGCEHNWSMFDKTHIERHNRIAQKRLNDIIYVHYNLRLRERQIRKRSSDSVFLDSVFDESLLYDWIVESEKQILQEDEVRLMSKILRFAFSFWCLCGTLDAFESIKWMLFLVIMGKFCIKIRVFKNQSQLVFIIY